MPIYEFICGDCGRQFETILSSTDTSGVVCDDCKSQKVKKVLSAPSIKVAASASGMMPAPSAGACGGSGFS